MVRTRAPHELAHSEESLLVDNKLAVIYMQGIPGLVSMIRELGINYFRRAAALGDRNGQHNLDAALHAYPEYCLKDECPWRKSI